jgi:16S rRNA processing protein RimM
MPSPSLCLGIVTGAHGVRGLVKIKPYTADPADLLAYGPLSDAAGRRQFAITLLSFTKGEWLARIEGVADRAAAEALRGAELHVPRAALPPPDEEEFYHVDLIGLEAVTTDGSVFGRVHAVHDFGAGEMLEIRDRTGGSTMLPFTRAAVPSVDLAGGRITVDPPREIAAAANEEGP